MNQRCLVLIIFLLGAAVKGFQVRWLTTSSRTRPLLPLEAHLSLETIAIACQNNPLEYERLLRAKIPPSDTIIRWYIARFTNDTAIIEVVVEIET